MSGLDLVLGLEILGESLIPRLNLEVMTMSGLVLGLEKAVLADLCR